MTKYRRFLLPILLAVTATLPGLYLRLSGTVAHILEHHAPDRALLLLVAACAGLAVLGASFLLLWACDAAQEDISQTLALAIVALIAVLPEYAVDMYITWQAGHDPSYAPLAIANMTGANRLIIGVAWMVIAGIYWFRTRKSVHIGADRRTELFFLGLATVYAIIIAIKGSLQWYDGLVYIGIYVWYIRVAGRRPVAESDAEGPAELLLSLPTLQRRLATIGLFLFAALVILANAEPFAEGLIKTGQAFHVDEFFLVQWLAPIASEAPEFTVAIMFALRLRAGLALGSLLSANLNQWTLLVGMIPFVYAIAHGTLQHPIPMNAGQMHEIMLTAAQSLLGIVILATLRLSVGQALLLFTLFLGQLILPAYVKAYPAASPFGMQLNQIHPFFSAIFIALAIGFFLDRPKRLNNLWKGVQHIPVEELPPAPGEKSERLPIT